MLAAFGVGCACQEPPRARGDALVLLLPQEPLEVDPRHVGDAQGLRVSRLIFAGLVAIDPLTLEAVPDLARAIDVSEDGLVYTAHLREDTRFSDRSVLDADDVLATFRSVADPAVGSRYAETYRRVTAMSAPDPRTVVFRLEAPHAPFLTDLELPIVRAEDAQRHLSLDDAIGAGPYRLSDRIGRSVLLEASPTYHAEVAHPDVLLVVVRDDNTRALRMLAGSGDLAIGSIPPLLVPMLEEDDRFTVRRAPGIGTAYLGVNLDAGALADRRVREAIAFAIDREALVRSELGGRGSVADGWIPPGHWADDPSSLVHRDFDPARAMQLLDEAGLRDPDGAGPAPRARFAMRCATDRTRVSAARAIAAMLRDVGLEVEVRPSETASLLADLGRGRFELAMMAVPEVIEPHVLEWFFGSSRIPAEGRAGGANRWRFRDAAFDAALARGRSATRRAERRAAYVEAQRILSVELPVIPLWHEDVVAVASERARDVPVPRDGRYGVLARRE